MLQIVIYQDEDGIFRSGFLVPTENASDGHEVIASGFENGKFTGPFFGAHAASWRANIHLEESNTGQWINVDATKSGGAKILCDR